MGKKKHKHADKVKGSDMDDVRVAIGGLEEEIEGLQVRLSRLEPKQGETPDKRPPTESFRTSSPHIRYFDEPIYVTMGQAKSMSDGDTWIMAASDDGWLLIGNGSVPHDEEGNGVWHDAAGDEHDGPVGSLRWEGTD